MIFEGCDVRTQKVITGAVMCNVYCLMFVSMCSKKIL